jgi:hypothetical protein
MTIGSMRVSRSDPNSWRIAAAGLVAAAAIVGVAIIAGGTVARTLNGIGAVVWLVSGLFLAVTLPDAQRRAGGWVAALAGALLLGAVVRPGELGEVLLSFAVAGALVVLIAGDRVGAWALLVPAIYLPVHLVIGIGRAILTNGGVRTEPPPTAAVVPLAMLLAATVAGMVVASLLRRGD